ncbi:type I-F CRISPR-associated protein Csy2 [Caldimonas aquatica]|uniref:Type I-F CRISPR-associated protein Csy2 n=1 Tax=Caldimonas aquatica TaxID=376175 RepID=A0ABY6MRV0_9BURK|nr:type I-F CRISPR-associated protein Csy2 [Schlegelella aquatica]UZD54727.1 type I-F CRISPR-associated protein Csy2 [Schlegelella aquatica]
MSALPQFDHLLVLPRMRVQNANAVSSPLTHGFPSMTAFLGLMWALERRTRATGLDLAFKAVGVVCHDHQEQVSDGGFIKSLRLTRNPVEKDGSTAAIVEEGRIHLELSLVFAVRSEHWMRDPAIRDRDVARVAELLGGMRIAGGAVLPDVDQRRLRHRPWVLDLTGSETDQRLEFRKAKMRLLPGFALVSRDELLDRRLAALRAENPTVTRLDAWLSLSRVNWTYRPSGKGDDQGEWVHDRDGWIVPIPVGYGALGGIQTPGTVSNARDTHTPFHFVESLYSIGEWISPHRLHSPRQMLWYADSQPGQGRYRCRNDYAVPSDDYYELD